MGYYRQVVVTEMPSITVGDIDINDISKGIQTNDVKMTLDGETVLEQNSAAIKAALEILDNIVSGNEAQVDIITMPTVTETNSNDIKTALQILDNIVSGNEAQVDIITMPTANVVQQNKSSSHISIDLLISGVIIPAGGVGTKIRLYKFGIYNKTGTGLSSFTLNDGVGGTQIYSLGLPIFGGSEYDMFPYYYDLTANTALYGTIGIGGTPRVAVNVTYEVI